MPSTSPPVQDAPAAGNPLPAEAVKDLVLGSCRDRIEVGPTRPPLAVGVAQESENCGADHIWSHGELFRITSRASSRGLTMPTIYCRRNGVTECRQPLQ